MDSGFHGNPGSHPGAGLQHDRSQESKKALEEGGSAEVKLRIRDIIDRITRGRILTAYAGERKLGRKKIESVSLDLIPAGHFYRYRISGIGGGSGQGERFVVLLIIKDKPVVEIRNDVLKPTDGRTPEEVEVIQI